MIEFIQDYVTKALPPESFEDGQRVKRSPQSELYFVQLGVAGYVINDTLVDAEHHPIVRKPVAVVVTTDRRFADAGRGGEMLGLLDAPQRASTGPGNAVVFSGQPDSTGLHGVEIDQLRSDLAASIEQLDEHRTITTGQIDALTTDLTAAQGAREAALADVTRLTEERDQARAELAEANAQGDQATEKLAAAQVRITDLEVQVAAASKAKAGKA